MIAHTYAEKTKTHTTDETCNVPISHKGTATQIGKRVQDDGERFVRGKKRSVSGASLGALGFPAGLQFSARANETKSFSYKIAKLAQALSDCGHGILLLVHYTLYMI